jgi:glycosyltransferase involved in cell wall biosynthesis
MNGIVCLWRENRHDNRPREINENHAGMIEVVIPAYNAGQFLRETLLSVASQSLLPDVVTVVDDASTDDTVAVAKACGEELAGRLTIRVIPNDGPRGPSAGRNTAIRESRAEWIALLDSDDLLAPNHHATLLGAAQSAGDVVLGFGDSTWFFDNAAGQRETEVTSFFKRSGVADLPAAEIAPGHLTLGDRTFPAMLDHGPFGTSACLFRREVALQAGLFDEAMSFSEDTDFFLHLALFGRFAFSRAVTTHKRIHSANLSQAGNHLAFSRGIVLSYSKLSARTEAPRLTAAQSAAVDRALTRAVNSHLFVASRKAPTDYRSPVRLAWQAGRPLLAAHPRHLVRTALHFLASRGGA